MFASPGAQRKRRRDSIAFGEASKSTRCVGWTIESLAHTNRIKISNSKLDRCDSSLNELEMTSRES